jgi:N6-L-threonylcarbamoyladenine synthase/protein kinase Bud32
MEMEQRKKLKLLAKGAEADVFMGEHAGIPSVFKIRNSKKYRVAELDEQLRTTRTKKEARLLHQAKAKGARCPTVLYVGKYEIVMEFMKGTLMRDSKKIDAIAAEVGMLLAKIHLAGITHGDFTPANVMMMDGKAKGVAVIDFGLGEFGTNDEERATDVLLMKKSIPNAAYKKFAAAYAKALGKAAGAVMARLGEIELRGRYVARGALG